MPSPNLTRDERQTIREILAPNFLSAAERSATIQDAFADSSLTRQIDFSSNTVTFVEELIRRCLDFGDIAPGEPALWRLLLAIRARVGMEKQREIDRLAHIFDPNIAPPDDADGAAEPNADTHERRAVTGGEPAPPRPEHSIVWLHLSDWHQRGGDFDRQVVRDALVRDIAERADIANALANVDFCFFTGDLAYSGHADEYQTAGEQFLKPVLDAAGVERSRLYTIPGNHDHDRSELENLAVKFNTPPPDVAALKAQVEDKRPRDYVLSPFAAYSEWHNTFGAQGFGAFGGHSLVRVGGRTVGIVGANSALFCARQKGANGAINDYGALGIGEYQIYEPLRQIAQADLRIALVHHPFEWLLGFDRDETERRLTSACQFVLRGHEHSNDVRVVTGTDGSGVVLRGGAAYDRRRADNPRYVCAYNFVRYNFSDRSFTVYLRRWSERRGRWIADTDAHDDGQFRYAPPAPRADAPADAAKVALPMLADPEQAAREAREQEAARQRALRDEYARYVANRWAVLPMRGAGLHGRTADLPLDEVYVSLTIERETMRPGFLPDKMPQNISGDPDLGGPDLPEAVTDSPTDDPRNAARRERNTRFESERVTQRIGLADALRDHSHIVILGGPGAGKTTLTHFLARQFALALLRDDATVAHTPPPPPFPDPDDPPQTEPDRYGDARLPLLLRIADYAEALRERPALLLRDFLSNACGECEIGIADAALLFQDALRGGRALVILDGLDEVAEDEQHARIGRRITDFVTGLPPGNRVIVTSRIVGYDSVRLPAPFVLLSLGDMDRGQIVRFVGQRTLAFARTQADERDEATARRIAQPDRNALLQAIADSEGVGDLARTPLLLGVLCLIQRAEVALPQRRVELYERASRVLLEGHTLAKAIGERKAVSWNEAERLLAPLADWMHRYTDNNRIARRQAEYVLRSVYAERHGVRANDPDCEDKVEAFLRRLCHDSGILTERGRGELAFLHLSFQEYWAARFLVRDFAAAPALVRARRHRPRYAEVVRLAVAGGSERDATTILRAAVWCEPNFPAPTGYEAAEFEEFLYRDLVLAALCLADCADPDPTYLLAVAGQITTILLDTPDKTWFYSLRDRLRDALTPLLSHEAAAPLLDKILARLADDNASVRQTAVDALGASAANSEPLQNALIARLADNDADVHIAAARTLAELRWDDAQVVQQILDWVTTPGSYNEDDAWRALERLAAARARHAPDDPPA